MKDVVLAICVLAGAAIYLRAAVALPQLELGDPLGPQVFPILIGLGLAVSGVLLHVEAWRKQQAEDPAGKPPARHRARYEYALLAGMAAWTAAYYAAFEPVGYILSTIVYLFGLLCVFQSGRWLLNLACACAFTAVASIVFGHFLNVVLPSGVLPI